MGLIWGWREGEYFSEEEWTGGIGLIWLWKLFGRSRRTRSSYCTGGAEWPNAIALFRCPGVKALQKKWTLLVSMAARSSMYRFFFKVTLKNEAS
jgi:hypothetical protein